MRKWTTHVGIGLLLGVAVLGVHYIPAGGHTRLARPVWLYCRPITGLHGRVIRTPAHWPLPLRFYIGVLEIDITGTRIPQLRIDFPERTYAVLPGRAGRYRILLVRSRRYRRPPVLGISWKATDSTDVAIRIRQFDWCRPYTRIVVYSRDASADRWIVPLPHTLYLLYPHTRWRSVEVRPIVPARMHDRVDPQVTIWDDLRTWSPVRRSHGTYVWRTRILQRTFGWLTLRLHADCTGTCSGRMVWSVQVRGIRTAESAVRTTGVRVNTGSVRLHPVVLVLIDALRADHLRCRPLFRRWFPAVYRLCHDSWRFAEVYAHSGWTRTSVASLLTGLLPHQHSVRGYRDMLPGEVPYLPEILQQAGYHTAAFITNGNVSGSFGFDRGFDHFWWFPERIRTVSLHVPAPIVARAVQTWLRTDPRIRTAPFFLYIHFTDPHVPYTAAQSIRAVSTLLTPQWIHRFRRLSLLLREKRTVPRIDQYGYDVWMALYGLNMVIEQLIRDGRYHRTLIVVTADHGEAFWEYGCWGHGECLTPQVLRVPLWIKWPGETRSRYLTKPHVQLIDVVPTILDSLGIAGDPQQFGRSLRRMDRRTSDRVYLAEQVLRAGIPQWVVERQAYRLYWHPGTGPVRLRQRLYNHGWDRDERHNLAFRRPIVTYALLRTVREVHRIRPGRVLRRTLTREERELLRALGYVQ